MTIKGNVVEEVARLKDQPGQNIFIKGGVFLTRWPDRPNPIGLHRTTVLEIQADRLLIGPIEVIDGTPVLDIEPVVEEADDF